jgi:hypothetical protein
MKQKLKQAKDNISKAIDDVLTRFEARNTFITFAVIYLPVSWLFLGRGALEQTLLVLYTGLMILGGLVLIKNFLKNLIAAANAHDGKYGDLFKSYLIDMLLPLGMFKLFALIGRQLLPYNHEGVPQLLCQLYDMLGWLYPNFVRGYERPAELVDIQQALGAIIVFSAALMVAFTLWSVARDNKNK